MNKTKYLQTDSRWSNLGYPKSPCTIGNSGCGEVSICNAIIEMEQYKKYTPKTIQPYCKQYAASNCDGTYWSGIPKMLKNYGCTEVKEHANMNSLWKELAKGDRVAIYLMGSRPGGSKRVHWTSGGHFVCSVDYRYVNGEHQVYMKDSNSNSSLRNGWIGYSTHLKGDVSAVWSGKLNGAKPSPSPAPAPTPTPSGKLTVDGIGGKETVKAMQKFFKTSQDGVIGGQNKNYEVLYPSLTSVSFGRGGSECIEELQKWLGLSNPDGVIGKKTTKAWKQKLVNLGYLKSSDGKVHSYTFGVGSMKAWQECLNNNGKKKGGTPTPKPTPKPSKTDLKVIDVSEFQSAIDWKKAKADGVKGAIVRCGFRGATTGKLQEDAMFLKHIKGAYKAGIPVGIYMFTEAINEKEGREEAHFAIKMWKKAGVPLSFPIAVDTEPVNVSGERAKNLTKAQRTKAIKGFCEKITERGFKPMIYASTSWLNSKLDMSKLPYDVWCAQYYSKCEYKGKYVIWQYTSEGKVDGIKGVVDLNHCYIEPKEYKYIPPKKEEKTIIDKEMDACKEQAEWMKNYHYEWESNPTIPKSKKKGTCVTYVACVLQRIGVLKSGQCIWHTGKGYGTGKVYGTNDKMTTTYMDNKTFTACKSKLKKGDIVMVDDNKSGKAGNGGHIMIFAGKWSSDGKPYIYDNASAERVKQGKSAIHTYGKSRKILAIVRLK